MGIGVRQALREVIRERGTRVLNCQVRLLATERVADSYIRVTITGEGLADYIDPRAGDAFKLFLPSQPGGEVPEPSYDERGRLCWPVSSSGDRPRARCFTVQGSDAASRSLTFDALLHPDGATAQWLAEAREGDRLGFTGIRTEFVDVPESTSHLLIGDASALPAVAAVARAIPPDKQTSIIALADESSRTLPDLGSDACLRWTSSEEQLLRYLAEYEAPSAEAQVWVGAEAGLVRRIRRLLLDDKHVERDALHASAYWKRGLDWEQTFDESMERFLAAGEAGADVSDPGVLQSLAFD